MTAPRPDPARALYYAAISSYLLLILLTLAWEGFLAPSAYAPPGLWLTIKSLLLLVPLFPLLRGHARAFVAAGFLLTAFFADGLVVAYTTFGQGQGFARPWVYAAIEVALCLNFFIAGGLYARHAAQPTVDKPVERA